jgi:hypothetical protein
MGTMPCKGSQPANHQKKATEFRGFPSPFVTKSNQRRRSTDLGIAAWNN